MLRAELGQGSLRTELLSLPARVVQVSLSYSGPPSVSLLASGRRHINTPGRPRPCREKGCRMLSNHWLLLGSWSACFRGKSLSLFTLGPLLCVRCARAGCRPVRPWASTDTQAGLMFPRMHPAVESSQEPRGVVITTPILQMKKPRCRVPPWWCQELSDFGACAANHSIVLL